MAAAPAHAADPANGERLARRWCASCHVIAPDQNGPTTEAPPFATIAKAATFDASRLALFLLDPHPKMPDLESVVPRLLILLLTSQAEGDVIEKA